MRSALSDPCLIKQSRREFLEEWNAQGLLGDCSQLIILAILRAESDLDDDLSSIRIKIEEAEDLEDIPENLNSNEKWKILRKLRAARARRATIESANNAFQIRLAVSSTAHGEAAVPQHFQKRICIVPCPLQTFLGSKQRQIRSASHSVCIRPRRVRQ